jgi:adenylate cyclase
LLGREEEARASAEEVLRIDPDFSVDRYAKIIPFKNRGKLKELIASYRMAGLK